MEEYGGKVPDIVEVLETLPGVGRKTASVVLNIAFGQPTHRRRHAYLPRREPHRLAPGKRRSHARLRSRRSFPDEYLLHAHHWLILHGRYVCKARRPECWRCPINDLCRYPDKTIP